ncbi:DUF2283 domain-containing protein [Candidatus Woesearchaeota archaeon]|nr:DUF2283 domain-containing protein [Candidatus Woesearchaeota archaeon]
MAKKIIYDSEEDILSLTKGVKVKSSMDIGDFVIDIDHEGFISGIEILNASQNLGIEEEQLKTIEEASMNITYKPGHVLISLLLKSKRKEKEIAIPLTVDLGRTAKTEKTRFAIA